MEEPRKKVFAARPDGLRRFDDLLLLGVIGGVGALTIVLGGTEEWTQLFFAMWIGLLAAAWGLARALSGRAFPVPLSKVAIPAASFSLLCLFIVLQISTATPADWHHPNWTAARDALGTPLEGAISLDPGASRRALLTLVAYGGVFWLSLQLTRAAPRAKRALVLFVAIEALLASWGLAAFLADMGGIPFFDKTAYVESLTSTFVNRNSYATFAGLGLVAAVSLLVDDILTNTSRERSASANIGTIAEVLFKRRPHLVLAIVVIAIALVLTRSRAGNAATAFALATLPFLLVRARLVRARWGWLTLVLLAGVGLASLSLGGEGLEERFDSGQTEIDLAGRMAVYGRVLAAIGDSWIWGAGYGTFRQAFYPYIDSSMVSYSSWFDAHNTYLEAVLELGAAGGGLLLLTLAAVSWRAMTGLTRRRRDKIYCVAGVAATVLVALHSLVDFSMEIPAVAASYCLLMGIAVAQSLPNKS